MPVTALSQFDGKLAGAVVVDRAKGRKTHAAKVGKPRHTQYTPHTHAHTEGSGANRPRSYIPQGPKDPRVPPTHTHQPRHTQHTGSGATGPTTVKAPNGPEDQRGPPHTHGPPRSQRPKETN